MGHHRDVGLLTKLSFLLRPHLQLLSAALSVCSTASKLSDAVLGGAAALRLYLFLFFLIFVRGFFNLLLFSFLSFFFLSFFLLLFLFLLFGVVEIS